MKFTIKSILAIAAISLLLTSCSNDSKNNEAISGTGSLNVEFDNVFGTADLILDTQSNITSQNETLKISEVKYIVSNIVLTKEDGTVITYPKSESYFIVDESDEETHELLLTNIPAGNYSKIKFGIGVDETQYNLGATEAGNFWTLAQAKNMGFDWASGYKSLLFKGVFTSPTVTAETAFIVQANKQTTAYNYTEITLDFPNAALVRTDVTPDVHLFADVSKIIDGANKMSLTANSGTIGSSTDLPLITQNISGMFTVNHVHND